MSQKPRHTITRPHLNPWWAVLTFVFLAVLIWLLYTPVTGDAPSIFEVIANRVFPWLDTSTGGIDKVVHVSAFAAVTAAGLLAGWRARWVVGLNVAHALVSELIQWQFILGRTGDPIDAAADILGILCAWIIVALLWTRKEPQ